MLPQVEMAVEGEGGEVSQTVISIEPTESGHLLVPAERGRPPKGTHLPIVSINLPTAGQQVELGEGSQLSLTSSGLSARAGGTRLITLSLVTCHLSSFVTCHDNLQCSFERFRRGRSRRANCEASESRERQLHERHRLWRHQ